MTINKFLHQLKMLYCNRIDTSEGIDINKTSASKEHDNRNLESWWIGDVRKP